MGLLCSEAEIDTRLNLYMAYVYINSLSWFSIWYTSNIDAKKDVGMEIATSKLKELKAFTFWELGNLYHIRLEELPRDNQGSDNW